ncbi:hypothetical protein SAMN05660662_0085 [Blastococcus aurantiacus]|uniref:Uncharacterized protein n=1 Tax=Blastococcus aurantiacus TaxID=1550231 RepID=A0A1G7QYZ3_9ACTN|nr:hypothetical protein [Blastococcus aurantiacus]SDG03752.1 hypothetical protein SAMN05660662_0085 [Blastococcus aurantiacus]
MRTYRLLIGGGTVLDTFRAADLQPALRVAHLLADAHAAHGWHDLRSQERYQLQVDHGSGWAAVTAWRPGTAGVPRPRTPVD